MAIYVQGRLIKVFEVDQSLGDQWYPRSCRRKANICDQCDQATIELWWFVDYASPSQRKHKGGEIKTKKSSKK